MRRTVWAFGFIALLLGGVLHAGVEPSPVADAAQRNDIHAVRRLIAEGASVTAPQGDGMTALHWAAVHGDTEMARALIVAGSNVSAVTRINAYTPLFLASQRGDGPLVGLLLSAGARADAVSKTGSTPLMLAAASGDLVSVKKLLDAGAPVNVKESGRGQTALMFAAAYNRATVIRLLVERGAQVDATASVRDLYAFTRDRTAADPNRPRPAVPGADRNFTFNELVGYEGGMTALLFAARQGHVEAVKALLAAGAPINQVSAGDRTSPLLIATINGHFNLALLFLDGGANPNLAAENGVAPLYAAVACQRAAIAAYPQPRAHLQQSTSYLSLMKALLDKGADPNARINRKVWYSEYNHDESNMDETGATAFWRAAYAGDVEAMRLLAASGADPHLATIALPVQRRYGYVTQGGGLDRSGLPPVMPGAPAATPLLAAAGIGYGRGAGSTVNRSLIGWMPAVQYLVEELSADVNWRDDGGDTALHYAAARGDNEMILFLIAKGADVTAVNRAGQTVADMANGPTERGVPPFPETLALLGKLGVRPNYKCTLC
jgi:ankyrin repeat protein